MQSSSHKKMFKVNENFTPYTRCDYKGRNYTTQQPLADLNNAKNFVWQVVPHCLHAFHNICTDIMHHHKMALLLFIYLFIFFFFDKILR